MKNYKIVVMYDGSHFNGWQNQGNTENTIQNNIEIAIKNVINEKVEIIASGRTDKGVHSYGQVCNFKAKSVLNNEFLVKINEELQNSIVIKSIEEVDERFHARYNVKEKTYRVKVLNSKFNNPISRKYVYHIDDKIDVEKMKKAARLLVGEYDFVGFSSLKKTKKSTTRTITGIDIFVKNLVDTSDFGKEIDIVVSADGFLYNQVRIIVGTLLDIGAGKIKEEIILEVLNEKIRAKAGHTIPPYCLYLDNVKY